VTDSPEPTTTQAEPASTFDFTPVPRRFNRGDVWTEEIQRAFIETLADCGSVDAACRMVGRSPASAYRLRRHPLGAGFATAWQAAIDFGIQRIEDNAMDRAMNGVEIPVFAYGDKIATRRAYNDQLTMFMLRSRLPERYCSDGARAMSAIDKRKLERLKKQWREEWEEERRASEPDIEEARAEILHRLEVLRRADRAKETPRERELREAYEAEREARLARDEEESRQRLHAMIPNLCRAEGAEEDEGHEEDEEDEKDEAAAPPAEPPCAKPPLDLARAQILGAIEDRDRQLEVLASEEAQTDRPAGEEQATSADGQKDPTEHGRASSSAQAPPTEDAQ